MKRKFIISLLISLSILFVVSILVIVNTDNIFSHRAILARERLTGFEKINIGMSTVDVERIVGKPDRINTYNNITGYLYDINDDSYGSAVIKFNDGKRVTEVQFPKSVRR